MLTLDLLYDAFLRGPDKDGQDPQCAQPTFWLQISCKKKLDPGV